ncbi:MAG: hypothetical protein KFF50_09625 [Desulfatitalea sp.]|nr:hypothetical protein [Desulfatitalea sp.]
MLYLILIVLFILVFGFLGWRIWRTQVVAPPAKVATYVCPRCNERHCDCHKEEEKP